MTDNTTKARQEAWRHCRRLADEWVRKVSLKYPEADQIAAELAFDSALRVISQPAYPVGTPKKWIAASEALAAHSQQAQSQREPPPVCGFIPVRERAVNWLKEKYPALCEKAGLCERIGGRLYTVTHSSKYSAPQAAQPTVAAPAWITHAQVTKLCIELSVRHGLNLTGPESSSLLRAVVDAKAQPLPAAPGKATP